jgi:hypothetical protein
LKIDREDFEKYIKLSNYLEKSAEWRLPTLGLMEVSNLLQWFNTVGVRIQDDVKAIEAEEASAVAAKDNTADKSKEVLQKLKTAK